MPAIAALSTRVRHPGRPQRLPTNAEDFELRRPVSQRADHVRAMRIARVLAGDEQNPPCGGLGAEGWGPTGGQGGHLGDLEAGNDLFGQFQGLEPFAAADDRRGSGAHGAQKVTDFFLKRILAADLTLLKAQVWQAAGRRPGLRAGKYGCGVRHNQPPDRCRAEKCAFSARV